MSRGFWTDRRRDRLLAVATAVFAASTVAAARGIEDSLLSDAVGAGGVPQGVGLAMGAAAVALFAKSFIGSDPEALATPTPSTSSTAVATPAAAHDQRLHWAHTLLRTGGLVLILVGYGVLLPLLGYPLTVGLLVAASGWLAGAAPRWPLAVFAAASGALLWLLFDQLLRVRMPVGTLWA